MGALGSIMCGPNKRVRALVVSNEDGWSSEVLYKLTLKKHLPRHGASFTTDINFGNADYYMIDVNGDIAMRMLEYYFSWIQDLIFVVNSANPSMIENAKSCLHKAVNHPDMKDAIILIYAYRQNYPHALKPHELEEKLDLKFLKDRMWHIQPASADSDDDLFEGLQWLIANR